MSISTANPLASGPYRPYGGSEDRHTAGDADGLRESPDDARVVVLAPTGRDGPILRSALERAAVTVTLCRSIKDFVSNLRMPAGAAVITQEAIDPAGARLLRQTLTSQEAWSDLPIILLTDGRPAHDGRGTARPGVPDDPPSDGVDPRRSPGRFDLLADDYGLTGNVTLLERPVTPLTLVSAVTSGLRSRRRQYETRRLLRQLEDGVRQRDRFLAILGHELRNPLAAIRAACELINAGVHADVGREDDVVTRADGPGTTEYNAPAGRADPAGPGDHAGHLRLVGRQVELLTRLVDDLLDIGRIKTGKIVLRRRPIDLNDVVERCVEAHLSPARACRHHLTFERSAGQIVIDGDRPRLEQVVSNLLTNAIKYTPDEGAIVVRTERCGSEPPAEATLTVSDNGVGMSPKVLGGVFDLFTQADESLDRSQGGLGLGLALVRSLIESHGGSVNARSEGPGRGSTFIVRLPCAADTPGATHGETHDGETHDGKMAVEASPLRYEANPQTGDGRPTGRRVVLVEDNTDTRQVMTHLLRQWGHIVETAADGTSGIDIILRQCPDVAVVDVGLPGIDGYEIARRVKSMRSRDDCRSRPYLIALTGYGQPEDARRAREAGFDLHLIKPVDFAELRRALAMHR